MITLSNKNKKAINNIKKESQIDLEQNDIISENNFIFNDFSSDNLNDLNSIPKELRPKKNVFVVFCNLF